MVEIDDKLISLEIFEKKFACDISSCKGACCVKGDSGAPLTKNEIQLIKDSIDEIKQNMRPEGIKAIDDNDIYYIDDDNEPVTTLVNGEECAFVYFDENNIAKCSIEKTYNQSNSKIVKPISCHLYPIRVSKLNSGQALNYNNWDICKPACDCGEKLKLPVFRFLKNAIVRKWGDNFYSKLLKIEAHLKKSDASKT